jgi:maltose-binding protein MalE
MGENLGVASLPAGPNGPASPGSLLRVLAFGINSSPRTRQIAMDLGILQLNPLAQRTSSLNSQQMLPVNRYATPPVSSSSRLKALVNAQEQFQQSFFNPESTLSLNRIKKHMPEIESIFTKLVVDVIKPEQASQQLIDILRQP